MRILNIICRAALRQEQSILEIIRRTGLSRKTISKYLNAGTIEPAFTVPDRPLSWLRSLGSGPINLNDAE